MWVEFGDWSTFALGAGMDSIVNNENDKIVKDMKMIKRESTGVFILQLWEH